MTVYIDELFFENFLMNWIILYFTGYFTKTETKWYRLGLGAILGSVYVIGSVIFQIRIYEEVIFKIILSILIVMVSFKHNKFIEFIKSIIVFYLITFSIGGASFAISYFFSFPRYIADGVFYIDELPLKITIIATLVTVILIKIVIKLLKKHLMASEMFYKLTIYIFERKVRITAFLDTGNNSVDPISKAPVVFVEYRALYGILPKEIFNLAEDDENVIYKIENENWKKRIRIIPFSTVKNDHAILIGFKPDKIIISGDKTEIEVNNVVVALSRRSLSKNADYFALIGQNIFESKLQKTICNKEEERQWI